MSYRPAPSAQAREIAAQERTGTLVGSAVGVAGTQLALLSVLSPTGMPALAQLGVHGVTLLTTAVPAVVELARLSRQV